MKYVIIVYIVIAIVLTGCYKDNEETLYGEVTCDTTSVSFSNDILPIIEMNCTVTGCHVAGGRAPGIYENYNQIKAKVDDGKFKDRVLVQQDMPPGTPLTECQILYITKWLNDGAPNN